MGPIGTERTQCGTWPELSEQGPNSMKLTNQQVVAVREQTGADPIDDENPAMDTLREAFGDHTFYADINGLFVVEPIDEEPSEGGETAELVQICAWTDEQRTALQPVEPQGSGVRVELPAESEPNGNGVT